MSDWRLKKKYFFKIVDKVNNDILNKNIDGFDKIQNSFNRKVNKVVSSKKLTWKKELN